MPGDLNKITSEDVTVFKSTLDPIGYAGIGNALDCYQRMATKTAIYPGVGGSKGLAYVALKMNGEAGEFAEHVGKAMRDDGYSSQMDQLKPERKDALIKEVGDVLWYLSAACNELGITLSEAAIQNLEKLQSRTERGKLQGSGDNR